MSPDAVNPDWPKRTPDTMAALGLSTGLTEEQAGEALELMQQYFDLPPRPPGGKTPEQMMAVLHQQRANWIDTELNPVVEQYLCGEDSVSDFKFKIQSFNQQHHGFGFLGPFGMIFFHVLVNTAEKMGILPECDKEVRDAVRIPANEENARGQLAKFEDFVHRVGQGYPKAAGKKHGGPKPVSIPFFVSYFWQIQDRNVWPIYYTNAVHSMTARGLWKPSGHIGKDYIAFKHLYEELARLFAAKSGKPFDFYGVEHVFWFTGAHPLD